MAHYNPNLDPNDLFSYKSIRNNIKMFKSGVGSGQPEYMYDEPGYFFWKPIFYFYNGSGDVGDSGLLHPSWNNNQYIDSGADENTLGGKKIDLKEIDSTGYGSYNKVSELQDSDSRALRDVEEVVFDASLENSAYNYLLRNSEVKRARLLRNFINMLSDLNSNFPWYFKEISGLDEVVATKKAFFESPKIDESRKQITITCLSDSIDNKVGAMLDMYKAACFSWQSKRVIVPANLRKFDMGVFVFTKPYNTFVKDYLSYKPLNYYDDPLAISMSKLSDDNRSITQRSYKYLEFHNCEIDIESCKFGDSFSVEEPGTMEYKIVISYDNCYDDRYNDMFVGLIGDSIITDILTKEDYTFDYGQYDLVNLTGVEHHSGFDGILNNTLNQVISSTVGVLRNSIFSDAKGLLLGNLYHASLANATNNVQRGNVVSGIIEVNKAVSSEETYKKSFGNLMGIAKDAKNNANGIIQAFKEDHNEPFGSLKGDTENTKENTRTTTQTVKSMQKKKKSVENLGSLNNAKSVIKNI